MGNVLQQVAKQAASALCAHAARHPLILSLSFTKYDMNLICLAFQLSFDRLFGSSASFPCAVQPKNSMFSFKPGKEPLVIGVLMDKMDKVLEVNHAANTMTVQAQMNLGQLYAAATENNMSVMTGVVPAWAGLTLAGIMASSAHGSGYQQQSVLVSPKHWRDACSP
jgi:hypothetical protein